MIHLLAETSLFISLPNGCLCQIAGEPLIHMAPALKKIASVPAIKTNVKQKRTLSGAEAAEMEPQPKRKKTGFGLVGRASQSKPRQEFSRTLNHDK